MTTLPEPGGQSRTYSFTVRKWLAWIVLTANTGDPQYALDLAVAEVVRAGVAVLVAAGNSDTDACLKSPARSATFQKP